jgi:hypothetical protein
MQSSQKTPTRKKFLLWTAVAVCSAVVFKFLPGANKKKSNTVKMLTQDGTLVEIDTKLLAASGKKISDKELQQWVKPKTSQH